MTTSLKDKQAKKPKPQAKICTFCDKPVEPEWEWDDWITPDIHNDCRSILARFNSIGIDERFWKLPAFKVEDGNKKAHEATLDFIKNKGKGLFLFGPAGTGKTHLGVMIAQEIDEDVRFVKIPKLLLSLKANFDGKSWENEQIIERLTKIPVLILDDLGAEKASEWVAETLYILIDDRYGNMKPTVFTSNYSPSELAERLGDRIVSRIMEMCRIIEIKTSDKRKERR
jgi:DNA replication protein DnaC